MRDRVGQVWEYEWDTSDDDSNTLFVIVRSWPGVQMHDVLWLDNGTQTRVSEATLENGRATSLACLKRFA